MLIVYHKKALLSINWKSSNKTLTRIQSKCLTNVNPGSLPHKKGFWKIIYFVLKCHQYLGYFLRLLYFGLKNKTLDNIDY